MDERLLLGESAYEDADLNIHYGHRRSVSILAKIKQNII